MKTQNLIMVDFAGNDRRSVKAMLNGRGDGREVGWQKFERMHGAQMSQEELQAAYARASRGRNPNAMRQALRTVGKALLAAAAVTIIAT